MDFLRANIDFLALFLGKQGPPCENIDRYLHFAPVICPFRPLKKISRTGILNILNIDEVDGIYLASARGLVGHKTEPPDYILMFCSANVPGITYKLI